MFHHIRDEITCLYTAHQETQISVSISYSSITNSPNFLDHLQTIGNDHIFYPKSLINMGSNINLGNGVYNLVKS